MAMTYSSLVAAKGVSGSIANFVSYSKLDIVPILDEAQALIYQLLRCREMRTALTFTMPASTAFTALPSRFLDPIGTMFAHSVNYRFSPRDAGFVQNARNYDETSGTLGNNPLTTTSGSTDVTVALTGHGFNQGSSFYISGASAVGGITVSGSFPITSVATDTFVIDTSATLSAASSTATGGGAACAYTTQNLMTGVPSYWAVWDERIQFDCAFTTQTTCGLLYYQSLPLLTVSNTTNFLTNRYPQMLRTACMASAADFMKDDSEYQKLVTRLQAVIARADVESDLGLRGAEIMTENP